MFVPPGSCNPDDYHPNHWVEGALHLILKNFQWVARNSFFKSYLQKTKKVTYF